MGDAPSRSDIELLKAAQHARDVAYAPYSSFKVGAALRTQSGNIYAGCNVENASYSLSICAERVAVFKAAAAGDTDIVELAVFTDAEQPSPPCGACRQVLFEFRRDLRVILGNGRGAVLLSDIRTLFPHPFESRVELGV